MAAFPRDIISEIVVDVLSTAPSLAAVEGRVQHGELATLPDPVYPIITFHRDGTSQYSAAPYSTTDLVIIPWSVIGQDEAWVLHAGIVDLLDHQAFTRDDVSVTFTLATGPIPDPLRAPTALYRVIDIFTVRANGA